MTVKYPLTWIPIRFQITSEINERIIWLQFLSHISTKFVLNNLFICKPLVEGAQSSSLQQALADKGSVTVYQRKKLGIK